MNSAKKILLHAFALLNMVSVFNADAQLLHQPTVPDQYRAIHWSAEDGLPTDIANLLIKDNHGFLWIGSQYKGLCRFDGSTFKIYTSDKPGRSTITGTNVSALREDSLGNIWIGSDKGLARYDLQADTFTNFLPSIDTVADKTNRPFWCTSTQVYCIEQGQQIVAYDIRTFEKTTFTQLGTYPEVQPNNYTILDTASNELWMMGAENSIFGNISLLRLSIKTGARKYFQWPCYMQRPGHIHSFEGMRLDLAHKCIWLNSSDGLLQFSLKDQQFHLAEGFDKIIETKNYDRFVGIDIDQRGRIWVATSPHGIYIFDPLSGIINCPFSNQDLQVKTGEFNYQIYCDPDGIIWSSFWMLKGFYELLPFDPSVKKYTANNLARDSLSSAHIATIIPSNEGQLWIGTDDGINIFDPATEKFEVLRDNDLAGIDGDPIIPVGYSIDQRKIWLKVGEAGRYGGTRIYLMDPQTKECSRIQFRDGSKNIITASIESSHFVPFRKGFLLCDQGLGIFQIKENDLFADLIIPGGKLVGRMEVGDDRLLFLSSGDLLKNNYTYEYANEKWIKKASPLDSFVWSSMFYAKADQSLWASGRDALIHFDKNFIQIKRYARDEGFNGDIYKMLMDSLGNLWFINNVKQIGRLNTATGIITTLSEKDGIKKQNFDWFDPGAIDVKGDLYFGATAWDKGTGGLIRIRHEKFSSTNLSTVYLRSLYINHKPFDPLTGLYSLDHLKLKHNQNNISIETGVIDYYANGGGHIRYKLEGDGREESWQYVPAFYTIRYENLPSGTYKLRLQPSNANNEFVSPEKIITIRINPPFWHTWWFRVLAAFSAVSLIYAFVQYRSRNLRRRNADLEHKVTARTIELKESLEELKETQEQLIQQEKMASLGELTTGIAHEIQNPLNFVNNFSEVNTELIAEVKAGIEKGNIEEIKELVQDIGENEKKIMHHGKRADAIIKGMLQHSRASTGQKELTDINSLVDEYLRLSYHGLRAKDKSFNARLNTNFDERLTDDESGSNKINIIPQDIGRVVLNLFTNAFYAVHEKKKLLGEGFEPVVSVSTKRLEYKVEIRVRDNGNGIPEKIINKIFQPFFTTKPTGEGTGLGLSLSYDIITKAHGGELKVETKTGEYAEFTILLPVK